MTQTRYTTNKLFVIICLDSFCWGLTDSYTTWGPNDTNMQSPSDQWIEPESETIIFKHLMGLLNKQQGGHEGSQKHTYPKRGFMAFRRTETLCNNTRNLANVAPSPNRSRRRQAGWMGSTILRLLLLAVLLQLVCTQPFPANESHSHVQYDLWTTPITIYSKEV
jgi:hypothetical protein